MDALFEARDEFLGSTVVVKVLDAVDEVGVLGEVHILPGLALLAHAATVADLDRADEGQGLSVFGTQLLLAHPTQVLDNNIIDQHRLTATKDISYTVLQLDETSHRI